MTEPADALSLTSGAKLRRVGVGSYFTHNEVIPMREKINPLDVTADTTPAERQQAMQPFLQYAGRFSSQDALLKLPPEQYARLEPALIHEVRERLATSGQLFEFARRDPGGRLVTTSEGDVRSWMDAYDSPPVRIAFNKNAGRKYIPGHWEK